MRAKKKRNVDDLKDHMPECQENYTGEMSRAVTGM